MPNVIIIPTSHIAAESHAWVKEIIQKERPDCVALELDQNRYLAMLSQRKGSNMEVIRNLGFPTFVLYWTMRRLQNFLSEKTGLLPGSEMLKAIEISKELAIPVAFIDQNIIQTFLQIKAIKRREKLGLFWLLAKASLGLAVPFGKKVKIDLNKVPDKEIVGMAMEFMKKELPGFYAVLVGNRNRIMAANLKALSEKYPKIVAVVGAGHEKGIREIMEKKG